MTCCPRHELRLSKNAHSLVPVNFHLPVLSISNAQTSNHDVQAIMFHAITWGQVKTSWDCAMAIVQVMQDFVCETKVHLNMTKMSVLLDWEKK